jgi:hypothetical protein
MSWLNPAHAEASRLERLERDWRVRPNLRIHDFLAPERAEELHRALSSRALYFHTTGPGAFRYQYWADSIHLDDEAEPVAASFARWLYSEGMAWVSEWTGLTLRPPSDRKFLTTLYTRGCYLDPHNDTDGSRSIAFVVGMTREQWPVEEGGSLEFLECGSQNIRIAESRAPGFNTIDLFSVYDQSFIHRVRMLRGDRYRRVLAGWFHLPE